MLALKNYFQKEHDMLIEYCCCTKKSHIHKFSTAKERENYMKHFGGTYTVWSEVNGMIIDTLGE